MPLLREGSLFLDSKQLLQSIADQMGLSSGLVDCLLEESNTPGRRSKIYNGAVCYALQ